MAAKIAHPEVKAFVEDVMARAKAANPTELSKLLGEPWTERDQQRKLYKWRRGEQAPNFYGTIALLRLAGRLVEQPSTRQTRVLDEDAVLRALEDLADLQERQDELLFGLLDREVAQRPPRPARRKKGA